MAESITCADCGAEIETADDIETEEVSTVETVDESDGSPRITLGADKRDLYLCKGCGKVLGVN